MVRARVKKHLTNLQAQYPSLLGDCEILGTPNTDYAWRLFIAKSVWSQVLADLGEETDYDNFKSAVAKHQGPDGTAYEHALHDVWNVMYKLQK